MNHDQQATLKLLLALGDGDEQKAIRLLAIETATRRGGVLPIIGVLAGMAIERLKHDTPDGEDWRSVANAMLLSASIDGDA